MKPLLYTNDPDDVWDSYNIISGCTPNGFGRECDNCIARPNSRRLAGIAGPVGEMHNKLVTVNPITNKQEWTGERIESVHCCKKANSKKHKNFLVSYDGEVGYIRY